MSDNELSILQSLDAATIQRVAELARAGLTNGEICSIIAKEKQVDKGKLEADKASQELQAYGRAIGVAQVAAALYEAAVMGDVRAQMFYLRAKGNWRDGNKSFEDEGMKHEDWVEQINRKLEKDVGTEEIK